MSLGYFTAKMGYMNSGFLYLGNNVYFLNSLFIVLVAW